MGIRLASATLVILNINKINISHKIHFVYLTLTLALLNPSQSKTHYINVVLNIYIQKEIESFQAFYIQNIMLGMRIIYMFRVQTN